MFCGQKSSSLVRDRNRHISSSWSSQASVSNFLMSLNGVEGSSLANLS